MKQAEDNYKKAHALIYSPGNLTLLLLRPRYWMPLVYLIQYSVSSTETPGKSFLLLRKRTGASVRERSWPRWCKAPSASWPLRIHYLFSSVSPLVLPFMSSKTSLFQRHSSLRDEVAARVPLISNFAHSRTPGNKGRGLSILSLLTIAVLIFKLWSLFCATAWNRNVGAVPKFAVVDPNKAIQNFNPHLCFCSII